jgi:5'-nucleotidase
MHILLTNDDSHSSPLLRFLIDYLRTIGDVTIVVPKEEQSWTGKSITRFRPLHVDEIKLGDTQAFCVDGTPADCVNLALYNLVPEKPDLVVSGINIGRNTGVGFAISSGTIGACLEGNIAGIPGIAFSQDLASDVFAYWSEYRGFRPEDVNQLAHQAADLLPRITDYLLDGLCDEPVTWNVNLPQQPAKDCRLTHAYLGYSLYDSCFEPMGDQYRHNLKSIRPDTRPDSDGEVIKAGHVSLTKIDIREIGRMG